MIRPSVASALRALADLIHPVPQKRPGVVLVDAPISFRATPNGVCDPDEIVRLCDEALHGMRAETRGAA